MFLYAWKRCKGWEVKVLKFRISNIKIRSGVFEREIETCEFSLRVLCRVEILQERHRPSRVKTTSFISMTPIKSTQEEVSKGFAVAISITDSACEADG